MIARSRSSSPWLASTKMPTYLSLAQNISADVCVIGGGIAGLTSALLLAREGKKVVVLEKNELGSGETSHTTAHLTAVLDDRFYDIEDTFGADATRLAVQSHREAISKIEEIVRQENIECDFVRLDGYLFSPSADSNSEISKELETINRLRLMPVEFLENAPFKNYSTGNCLRFPNQAQFHPLKYLAGLAQALEKVGGSIYTNTTVTKLEDDHPVAVRTANGTTVFAGEVIVATNSPINDPLIMHIKQAPYRTYVIGARIPADTVKPALYWDTEDPYHYVRLEKAEPQEGDNQPNDLLIIGGEDHKTGQADDAESRYQKLEEWAREHFPQIKEIEFRWSGQVQETIDGLAYIGRQPAGNPHIYIATGDSGMGMTHGTIAGTLLTDLIMGRKNARQQIFDPARVMVGSAGEFLKEGLNVASQYLDWLTTENSPDKVQLSKDSGTIVSRGLNKIALYRDTEGSVHACSAVCTHLKCIVAWNSFEKSWDCPCHGSRFDPYGKVITGPAIKDLKPLETRPREK